MFSSLRINRTIVAVGFALVLGSTGCSLKDTTTQENKDIDIGGSDMGCLTGASGILADFLDGRASETQIKSMSSCAIRAIDRFTARARGGANETTYSARDLRDFVQTYFLRSYAISDNLLSEFMQLKRSLIGGGTTTWNKAEIEDLKSLIRVFEAQMLALRTHMPYEDERLNRLNEISFEMAEQAMVAAGEALGARFKSTGQNYDFDRLSGLLLALERMPGLDARVSEKLRDYRRWIPQLRVLKSVLLGSTDERILSGEWGPFFAYGAKVHGMWIRYSRLSDTPAGWQFGAGRAEVVRLYKRADTLLKDVISRQSDRVIGFADIDRLIDLVEPSFWPTTVPIIKRTLRPVIRMYLGGVNGIDLNALTRVRSIIDDWNRVQAQIESGVTPEAFKAIPVPPAGLFGAVRTHTRESLSALNWMSQIVRMGYRGYAKDPERARTASAITAGELDAAFRDLREFGVAVHFLDPVNGSAARSRFREANLFMSTSNGNDFLEQSEATELIAFLYSSKTVSSKMHTRLTERCRTYANDIFEHPTIDTSCVRDEWFYRFSDYFGKLPTLTKLVVEMNPPARRYFLDRMEESTRALGLSPEPVDSRDTDTGALMTSYVESLFSRWDVNRDQFLSEDEARAAFPVFRKVLRELPQVSSNSFFEPDANLRSLFLYLVDTGKPPESDNLSKLQFWGWSKMEQSGRVKIRATRVSLYRIFAELSKSLSCVSSASYRPLSTLSVAPPCKK